MYMSIRDNIMLMLGEEPNQKREKNENKARNMIEDFLGPLFYKMAKENPDSRYFEIIFTCTTMNLGIYYTCKTENSHNKNFQEHYDFKYSTDVLDAALIVAPKYDISVSSFDINRFEHVYSFSIDIR